MGHEQKSAKTFDSYLVLLRQQEKSERYFDLSAFN